LSFFPGLIEVDQDANAFFFDAEGGDFQKSGRFNTSNSA
jgi:hypothetical protein